jgi:hypothetical protein
MKRLVLAGLLTAGAVAAAVGFAAVGSDAATPDKLVAVKAALAPYQSLVLAKQAGYSVKGEPCVSAPPPPGLTGTMGIHAVNADLVRDPAIDPLRPEIMLYLPNASGKHKLIGVEYFAVALAKTKDGPRPWFKQAPPPLGFAGSAPVVLGRRLDGPMAGHNPTMPWHYDLHVWLWANNPAGTFAPFNPGLSCRS